MYKDISASLFIDDLIFYMILPWGNNIKPQTCQIVFYSLLVSSLFGYVLSLSLLEFLPFFYALQRWCLDLICQLPVETEGSKNS